jgi:acrylyl-CoA reductase (NADPH)
MTANQNFRAIVVRQDENKQLHSAIETLSQSDLPEGEVLVRVEYSSLNFKDAAGMDNRGIFRQFPMVPGIDFAGTVERSSDPRYQAGDEVVLTGWLVGEQYWGGLSQYARVKADWLVKKPDAISLRDCMAIGTAGLTAMLSIQALEDQGVKPGGKPVLVTGAAGGLGSTAVTLLARKGYQVAALTGKPEADDYIRQLGATTIVPPDEFAAAIRPGRMTMHDESFAGAIDVVGGAVLSSIFPKLTYGASVAVCGLAAGIDFETTVFPFILRAIHVIGIDSVRCPTDRRYRAWSEISKLLTSREIQKISMEIGLDDVLKTAPSLLKGQIQGRCVVKLW